MKDSLLSAFLTALLSLLACGAALAEDSGEERVVPVVHWQCWQCNLEYFTFDPDFIGADRDHKMHNDADFQQSNWFLLTDPGKPIPKCTKRPDGAHYFNEKRRMNTAPSIIREKINQYIVLKNGGPLKAKLSKWKCALCGLEGFAFEGDDLDIFGRVEFNKPLAVFNMKTGEKIRECGAKLFNNITAKCHAFMQGNTGNPKSYDLAKNLNTVWFSD